MLTKEPLYQTNIWSDNINVLSRGVNPVDIQFKVLYINQDLNKLSKCHSNKCAHVTSVFSPLACF